MVPLSVHVYPFVSITTMEGLTVLGPGPCSPRRSPQSRWNWSKIPAGPLQRTTTLRKAGSPFGLHSQLISGDTSAHSTLSPKILQVYGEIPEIRGYESSLDTGTHAPCSQGLDRLWSKVTQLVHGQP